MLPLRSVAIHGLAVLTGLRLRNIALIDSLELDFSSGFTVLTGETGAGKSILLDALDAVLGGAQGADGIKLLRNGCDRGCIEASFELNPSLNQWLNAAEFEQEEELLLSREWRRLDGDRFSSRSRLNGSSVNRLQLLELRPLLIDLTVQGQSQQLSRPGQQRRWLDLYGGVEHEHLLERAESAWHRWREASLALKACEEQEQHFERTRAEQESLLEQLDAAQLEDPDELQRLNQEQDRLAHAVRLQEGLALLFARFREGADQAPSLQEHFAAGIHELHSMTHLDASLAPLRDQALDLEAALQDLLRCLDQYGLSLESDPEHLDRIQNRLAELKRLQRLHGLDLKELISLRDQLLQQLFEGGFAADLERLRIEERQRCRERDDINGKLHESRSRNAGMLQSSLLELLPPMGLADVRFEVELLSVEPSQLGADAVRFLFSANPGQPLAPLMEVASGGEMSRFLLALKTILAGVDGSSTLLFDEIDAGVSGRVSGAMGDLLRALGLQRQVFCVTHQPLVAAAADHHFRVTKHVSNGVTHSRVSRLRDTRERRRALADLAGGEQAEAYAASLLDQHTA